MVMFFSELGNESGALDPLSAEALALADTASLQQALQLFCDAYDRWVQLQLKRLDDMADVSRELGYIAQMHLVRCEEALGRMRASVLELLTNPRLRRAFQLANFAMHLQHSWDSSKSRHGPLRWRPFQLGFLLLSAPSSVARDHEHRGVTDLLWFPTGGARPKHTLR
ncbi:hypothetical protein P4234_13380 [Pseudomonas aeruginosa]|nr:hypothetical protein [Pseudomonas aeruginosa]